MIPVPKMHGARATNGLALSQDGTALAYIEVYEPTLVLIVSTKDLSEVRRSSALPFTNQDYRRVFCGFDGGDHLSFASINRDKPRFVRMSMADFKVVSDTRASALTKTIFPYFTWDPVAGRFWLPEGGGDIRQFTEEGQPTGVELTADIRQVDQGAIALGKSGVLAFYAMVSRDQSPATQNTRARCLSFLVSTSVWP